MSLGQGEERGEREFGVERPHMAQQREPRGLGDLHRLYRCVGHALAGKKKNERRGCDCRVIETPSTWFGGLGVVWRWGGMSKELPKVRGHPSLYDGRSRA